MIPEPIHRIEIRYADLRRAAESALEFVQTQYWGKQHTLHTWIEADLGITGDDAAELMQRFAAAYHVDLSGFRFDRHFHPETAMGLAELIFLPVLLTELLLRMILAAGVFPVSRSWARKIRQFRTLMWFDSQLARICRRHTSRTQPADLRIGDLAASAAAGTFVLRDQVQFVLVRP
ncbi:MAG: DUF1493 family protein [Bacteroidia bacterium]|nr:DUF1493 family protein [Bacteroidia bacterium]